MVTIVVATMLIGVTLASALLWALLLRLGLRWAKVPGVTIRRVALAMLLVVVAEIVMRAAMVPISPDNDVLSQLLGLAAFVSFVIVQCLIIAWVFKASFLRALQAWLPTLLSTILMLTFVLLVFIPLFVEAFVIPTNSMAPTILGRHWRGTCSQCGGPAFSSPIPPQYPSDYSRPLMICQDNFHVMEPSDYDEQVIGGDRVTVAKFIRPRRWDLIVFRYPEDPSTFYVKRLVGMPGEEIIIEGGHIWANGKRLTPPESIRDLEYISEMPGSYDALWGSPRRPARLGYDEYFVLGDFSQRAKDSRFWQQGAAGHNPYAVPEDHLHGVVTNIYWPPNRWRAFR